MNPPTILECYVRFLNALPNNNALNYDVNYDFSNTTILILIDDNYLATLQLQITNPLSFKK